MPWTGPEAIFKVGGMKTGEFLEALLELDSLANEEEDWHPLVYRHAELKDAIRRIQGSVGP